VSALLAPPLALYVHVPWCVQKCPYCDFNSHARTGALPEAEYVAALLADLERDAPATAGRELRSVFIGGGTPSLFAAESIAALLHGIRRRVAVAADAEVTLEANPGTVEHGRFAGYRDAGVTRISLGAQSFGARQLALLGRIHAAGDTAVAVGELEAAGIGNFNLDLMYALPEQSLEGALADLDAATAYAPPHLSRYQLTLEPGTVFHARPPALPDEALADEMQRQGDARLAAAGYRRYEVSAWARPGAECRHNLNYWRYGDYLGIGAGAHGKLTDAAAGTIVRTEKPKQPRSFLAAAGGPGPIGSRVPVPPVERPFEFMLNALRLDEGFLERDYEARTGLPATGLAPAIEAAARRGLLVAMPGGWRPTALGTRFLNDLQALFLPGAVAR
jgi:putative oxygen-independent coproporphyrinogen III oxidase